MFKIKFILLALIFSLLSGCSPPMPQALMSPMVYDKPINCHGSHQAYLYWKKGIDLSTTEEEYLPGNMGLIGASVMIAINKEIRRENPSRYQYVYGKPQQAIFITSLKNILNKNHVFKKVEITTEPPNQKSHPILLTLYFKTTRVTEYSHRIILTADLEITHKDTPVFKRTYFVQSNDEKTIGDFKAQQEEASQQLLEKIIHGITQWQAQTKI